jgi:hypothetical protein
MILTIAVLSIATLIAWRTFALFSGARAGS